ncbi:MAG: hypothetical protein ACLQUY_12645 [Ktedonobacterales bacterium]
MPDPSYIGCHHAAVHTTRARGAFHWHGGSRSLRRGADWVAGRALWRLSGPDGTANLTQSEAKT